MAAGGGSYTVLIQDSAIEASPAVQKFAQEHGDTVEFQSRDEAEAIAAELSSVGARVRIQQAAPQEQASIDGYLVPEPDRRTRTPDVSPTGELTFDVGANQYGAIGETLVLSQRINPPLLTYYIRTELPRRVDCSGDDIQIVVDDSPDPIVVDPDEGGKTRWHPDCRVTARHRQRGHNLAQYWCEIKTGDASFERSQRAVMEQIANNRNVLAIRLKLEDLPESYTARVEEISPRSTPSRSTITENTRLDEFF